jgi:8-oxo-dGTP pyrophosphatase MutT (NUDIX family)
MRFEEVLRRLEQIPDRMPDGPGELVPVIVETAVPRARPPWDAAAASSRPAAVLVLLYPDTDGRARVVLTERVDRGGHHSGEVSFPGGKAEPSDADLVSTALREASEEVGLDIEPTRIHIVGSLPVRWIPVSNFAVTPVVAAMDRRPELVPQPSEVASILEPPVAAFLPGAPLITVERDLRGWNVSYAAYPVGGLAVWGMTAMVLGSLGAHLAGEATPDR